MTGKLFLALSVATLAFIAGCGGTEVSPPSGGGHDSGSSTDATSETGSTSEGGTGPGTCGLSRTIPPVLTVTDDTTGVPVCNAFLAADAGAGVGLYPCAGGEGCSGKCPYVVNDYGASGGTFSIEISAPGYGTFEVSNLRMQYCGCGPCPGPEEVSVKISMEATPLDAGTPD